MKLRSRALVLIGSISALSLLLVMALVPHFHESALRRVVEESERERIRLLDRIMELSGQPLRHFAEDYSLWGEMVGYLESRDPEWARVNIDDSLDTFRAHYAWVLERGGALVYATRKDPTVSGQPALPAGLIEGLEARRFVHFFLIHDNAIVEVRGAPVQPSDDVDRATPPLGWFLVGRTWDREVQAELGKMTDGRLVFLAPGEAAGGRPEGLFLDRPLPGFGGGAVRVARLEFAPPEVEAIEDVFVWESMLLSVGMIAVLVLTGWYLARYITNPLRLLSRSIDTQNPNLLVELVGRKDEVGEAAHLVLRFFKQQEQLRRELGAWRETQTELMEAEDALRAAMKGRLEVSRGLHDRVIQSLYGAGIVLSGLEASFRKDPTQADLALARVRGALEKTVSEVMAFVLDMEREPERPRTFQDNLREVFRRSFGVGATAEVRVDPEADARLSLGQKAGVLLFVRQAGAEALGHGRLERPVLSVLAEDGWISLSLEFERPPEARSASGYGELVRMARDLGLGLAEVAEGPVRVHVMLRMEGEVAL